MSTTHRDVIRPEDLPNPKEYPVLTSRKHRNFTIFRNRGAYRGWGSHDHFRHTVQENDAAAVKEFCKLHPDYPQWESRNGYIVPALTIAVDKPAILDVLLEHRETLRQNGLVKLTLPQLYDADSYEKWKQTCVRCSNPLTAACKIDFEKYIEHDRDFPTVRRVLAKLPEVGINDHDNNCRTPLIVAAGCANGEWCEVEDRSSGITDAEIERAIEKDGNGSGALITLLIENGADPNLESKLVYKVYEIDETATPPTATVVKKLESKPPRGLCLHGGPPLIVAMQNQACFSVSDPAAIAALVRGGADINKGCTLGLHDWSDGKAHFLTPLAVAALYHNVTGIKTLLYMAREKGIDLVNDFMGTIDTPSDPVISPIHAALYGWPTAQEKGGHWRNAGSLEPGGGFPEPYIESMEAAMATVRLLLSDPKIKEATLNTRAPHDGMTPLQRTARFDRLPMLRAMLDLGADPSIAMPKTNHSVVFQVFSTIPLLAPPLEHYLAQNESPELHLQMNYTEHREERDGPFPTIEDARRDLHESAEYECQPGLKAATRTDEVMDMHALVRDLLRGAKSDEERVAWINEADTSGNTALHWAAAYNLPNAKAALIAHGARTDIKNKAGQAPTDGQVPTLSRSIRDLLGEWHKAYTIY